MKVLVAHSGWQHSAHLAYALQKADLLAAYVTTIYDTPDSHLISMLKKIPFAPFREGIKTRKCAKLNNRFVHPTCTIAGLLSVAFNRMGLKRLYLINESILNWRFGRKVARLAIKLKVDAVVMYEGKAARAFRILRTANPDVIKVIDSAAACSLFVHKMAVDEYRSMGSDAPFFRELLCDDADNRVIAKEVMLADRYLVASSYVARSLTESGVASEKIMVSAYGGNFPIVDFAKEPPMDRPLRFVYCGRCTARKGVHHLLEAFKGAEEQLRLVGSYDSTDSYIKQWLDEQNISFVGKVTHDKVVQHLDWADVFIFPSLTDGMSLACAEALCRGLPLVCTDRTGISDYIDNGTNGFVVPAGDSESLASAVAWFRDHSDSIPLMSARALDTARLLTWAHYDERISDLFEGLTPLATGK